MNPVFSKLGLIFISAILVVALADVSKGQTPHFRVGEKLTYRISFDKFSNVGHAELHVVSNGKLNNRETVELQARAKTFDFVSAAFFLIDQSRTVFVAPDTGLPIYVRHLDSYGILPKETVQNYLTNPTTSFDLISAIYKARVHGGTGSYPLFEDGQQYVISFLSNASERVKTDAGEFDTTVSTVTSEFFSARGLRDLKINFSNDEDRLPVLFRFKHGKSEFRISLAGISKPEPVTSPTPTPEPARTPVPTATPRPTPSPTPYIDDRPLAPELLFKLGETLNYRVTFAGIAAGTITLNVKERKLINGEDTLVLTANVAGIDGGGRIFAVGDRVVTHVDPETLAPRSINVAFRNAFPGLNGTATFDAKSGMIRPGNSAQFEAPVGTHSILSLIYAMRSFNLTPSRDPSNPVNDTRVAVFWESKAYVFTLRPSKPEETTINGVKMQAQMISITTGNPQLDALAPKVWLSVGDARAPLRFTAGALQAELIQN